MLFFMAPGPGGEATPESDIDLLVVLAGEVTSAQELDRMIEIIADINLNYDTLLSVYPISAEDYATLNMLLTPIKSLRISVISL
jgi:predicted nucleotidyltransferase